MKGLNKWSMFLGVSALALAMAGQAQAVTFTGTGTNGASGNALSATADFQVVGSNLVITLTNTGAAASVPSDVLTGIFFQPVGFGPLTPVSALLNTGSTVLNTATQPAGGNVGGEWAYVASTGTSSTGLGIFGSPNFNGSNLQGPAAVDGLQYGIVNGLASNANSPMFSNQLISNSVVFTLSISGTVPSQLYASNFSGVSFQYGTSLTEPNLTGGCTADCTPRQGVPEPSSLLLLGAGLAGLGIWRRKASQV
jgi:hypothetical protein